jgi:hypothetical protein
VSGSARNLFQRTNCTRENNLHIETIKHLIIQNLLLYLKHYNTFLYKISHLTSLSFYVSCRYPSVIATLTLSNIGDRENATYSC